ncbi:MarR family transcriptional regulator [Lentzea flava]|uniref:DUF4388 domain-containing protein n=1 Tax=Lentzea flava TaxID=103732 RepID=A0ABQ2UK02_9PSEU|nr:MarR family transcriptional regulator [Lentzea flava]MCP2199133.1 hypothetical protein [Lentzea flava]GGU34275.1 hypothetical protein GCM10010178_28140 [Lentzea flava]
MRVTSLKTGTQFSFDLLAGALTGRDSASATGTLHVLGNPGGRIHLRDGGIICVESAGSPGPDALLLRTGRISESEWTAALTTGTRGNIGETELHVVAMMATQDAAFTIVAGDIEDCTFTPQTLDVPVAMSTAIDPIRLLQETSRRISSLLALKHPLSPHRDRLAPAPGSHLRDLGPVRGEILAHATGRRTTRDIAFASGRSVYPVTIEACRMVADGLLTIVPGTTVTAAGPQLAVPLRPRQMPRPTPPPPPPNPPPEPVSGDDGDDVPLPRSLRRQLLPKLFKQTERKKP